MKYTDRDRLVADLRELADLIEERGHKLPIKWWSPFSLVSRFYEGDEIEPKKQMIRAAKNIGKASKDYRWSDFELRKLMTNGMVELRFETNRENVCEKRVVSTKQVPKRVTVEIPNEYETVEDEIVWDCGDPLLASSDG